jgi:hypothetical protein
VVIRRLLAVVSGFLALLLGGACTAAPPAPGAAATASRAAPVRTAPHQAGLAGTRHHAGTAAGSITLAFAGDVNFAGRTARLLNDPATAFGPIAAVLRSADFTAVNLETAITSRGTPQPKTHHFRAPPAARFIPAVVSGTGQPIADRGAAARQAAARYASLRACAGLAAQPS